MHEVESESEEEVIVRRRPKRQVIRECRRKTPVRKVQYIEASESEEEVVQVRKPVKKQRVVPQAAKTVKVVVEEPQQKIVKSAKQTIQVPVTKTKFEEVTEEITIETEADR